MHHRPLTQFGHFATLTTFICHVAASPTPAILQRQVNVASTDPITLSICPTDPIHRIWTNLGLHIAGVLFIGFATTIRDYYAATPNRECLYLITFYTLISFTVLVAVYVNLCFNSSAMLLVGTAVVGVLIHRKTPRNWTVNFRRLHLTTPMWRTRKGEVYKRLRLFPNRWRYRMRSNDTQQCEEENEAAHTENMPLICPEAQCPFGARQSNKDWNGAAYTGSLLDGSHAIFIAEQDVWHWENSNKVWQNLMRKARLGYQEYQRAAMALRMASAIPFPAYIDVGRTEYFTARRTIVTEVVEVWKIAQRELEAMEFFNWNQERAYKECDRQEDLAMLLHLKMLNHAVPDEHFQEKWSRYATEWILGEVFVSKFPIEGQESTTVVQGILKKALAYGLISESEDSEEKYWYLLAKSDSEIFLMERAVHWSTRDGTIIKRIRRSLRPDERATLTRIGATEDEQGAHTRNEEYESKLVDGTKCLLTCEKEEDYWERDAGEHWRRMEQQITENEKKICRQLECISESTSNLESLESENALYKISLLSVRMAESIPVAANVAVRNTERQALGTCEGMRVAACRNILLSTLQDMACFSNNNSYAEFTNRDDLATLLLLKMVILEKGEKDGALVFAKDWLFGEIVTGPPRVSLPPGDCAKLADHSFAYGAIVGAAATNRSYWYLMRKDLVADWVRARPPDESGGGAQ